MKYRIIFWDCCEEKYITTVVNNKELEYLLKVLDEEDIFRVDEL